ncbi:MAG: transcription termination factor NusA [Deltaproteobacteria bacterium]|nr:transcription termination factor NusA [Deltaproteobacteria bacterium]
MEPNLIQIINILGKEKNIPKETIVEAIETAITTAAKKKYGEDEDIEVEVNMQKGEIEAYRFREVVENVEDEHREILLTEAQEYDDTIEVGDEFAVRLDVVELGRIAAQTAKQIIVQRVREAEREVILEEYGNRIGETVNGIVMRMERGALVVDLGKAEGILAHGGRIPGERYNRGDRIRALIKGVQDSSKTPQVILSRTDPEYLIKLFAVEVPEVYEGIVKITKVVREPGQRAKISVISDDSNVDPVGACVGIKGSRVQAVVQELRGEKIDIIEYTDVTRDMIEKALSPAAISRIAVNEEDKSALVVVEESQLSLAIGRRGQNVRFASQLTNHQINIMSETEYQQALLDQQKEAEAEIAARARALEEIARLEGVGEKTAQAIHEGGFASVAEIAGSTPAELSAVPGIGEKTAEKIIQQAVGLAKILEEEAAIRAEKEAKEAARAEQEAEEAAARAEQEAEEAATRTEEESGSGSTQEDPAGEASEPEDAALPEEKVPAEEDASGPESDGVGEKTDSEETSTQRDEEVVS